MTSRDKIQIDLIKLVDGSRLMRLSEPESCLALEKKLDPHQPVVSQRERLFRVFEAALAQASVSAA